MHGQQNIKKKGGKKKCGTMFLQNVRNFSSTDTASHPTRPERSITMLVCLSCYMCDAVAQDIWKVTWNCIPLNNILHLKNTTMYFEVLSNVTAK